MTFKIVSDNQKRRKLPFYQNPVASLIFGGEKLAAFSLK